MQNFINCWISLTKTNANYWRITSIFFDCIRTFFDEIMKFKKLIWMSNYSHFSKAINNLFSKSRFNIYFTCSMCFFFVDWVNHYIVQIYDNKYVQFFNENFIDQVLKKCWNINEIKKKNVILKMFIFRSKCCFSFVVFFLIFKR